MYNKYIKKIDVRSFTFIQGRITVYTSRDGVLPRYSDHRLYKCRIKARKFIWGHMFPSPFFTIVRVSCTGQSDNLRPIRIRQPHYIPKAVLNSLN